MRALRGLLVVLSVALAMDTVRGAVPLDATFMYQGQIKLAGRPLHDDVDFRFSVWDALLGGQQIGTEYQINGVAVENGLFTIPLNLGSDVFTGQARWLQVAVRYPTEAGSFQPLSPRQSISASPYATFSKDTRGVFVAADNKVGLGTTSPKQMLHVVGDLYARGHLWLHAFQGDGLSGTAYVQARDDSGTSSIDLRLRTQATGATVDVMTLKSSGRVGIGTPVPEQVLDVAGAARFGANAGPNLIIHDPNGGSDRPGIQFTNNTSHFFGGDDLSNEAFGFYSQFAMNRAYDAIVTIHGNTQGTTGTWNRYLALTHDGTDGKINTDTGNLLLNPAGNVGAKTSNPMAPLHIGVTGTNWTWATGNGWGDFCLSNGTVGLALGVATAGSGTGDSRLWSKGGTERLFLGNATDGVILTLDDGRVGIPGTDANARQNVTSLALSAPSEDWAAHFRDANGTGEAWLAGDDGQGRDKGIVAQGTKVGGQFYDVNGTGDARLAYTNADNYRFGVWARGDTGGYFESSDFAGTGNSKGWVGGPVAGVRGESDLGGGYFEDSDDVGWARVGWASFKISGNGSVSFVQNHPYDQSQVIVYSAPEGDEVATYTRGTARLVDGEARVSLGDTFQWVTNPDLGLTAHLTPRGTAVPLAVISLSTKEMLVRGPADGCGDVVFDYLVFGLRIGFEERSVVQEKEHEAFIPSMRSVRERYEKQPELRQYTALERYERMRSAIGETRPLDLTAAHLLRDAVHEFDPVEDLVVNGDSGHDLRLNEGDPGTTRVSGEAGSATRQFQQATADSATATETLFSKTDIIMDRNDAQIADLNNRVTRLEALLERLVAEPATDTRFEESQ